MRSNCMNGLFLALQSLVLTVLAQDFGGGLPRCAEEAALQTFETSGCQFPNITCICLNTQWVNSLEAVFEKACPPPAVTSAMNFASSLCIKVATITPHFPAPSTARLTFTTTVDSPQSAWMPSTPPTITAATATPASTPTGTSSWTTHNWGISTMTTTAVAAQATTAAPTLNATSSSGNTTISIPIPSLTNFTGGGSAVHVNAEAVSFVAGIYIVLHIVGLRVLGV